MSDYIFSSIKQTPGLLSENITSIYSSEPPSVQEFHGNWGSLALSQGHYKGFKPFETEQHILLVIGGPVLYFRDNHFLSKQDSYDASKAIYTRWIIENNIQWDEDLSGPFTILLVDKKQASVQVVTDLMAIIPVYKFQQNKALFLSTHVDALAKTANREKQYDQASLIDFILNDIITFPYTAYQSIYQIQASSVVLFTDQENTSKDDASPQFNKDFCKEPSKQDAHHQYWSPIEKTGYSNIESAAHYLNSGLKVYINRISEKMQAVAQFISGGEDSRALAGLLPSTLKRDGFIFLDKLNREGQIAQKASEIYGARFVVGYRDENHYLNILDEASRLVGLGHQYIHAHSLQFDKQFALKDYNGVFGGFLSDTLLKGNHVKFFKGYYRIPFAPQIASKNHNPVSMKMHSSSQFFKPSDIKEVIARRQKRLKHLQSLRPNTYKEWFSLWPLSMYNDMTNFYCTRRLFKSYEPFMCKEAVKVCAAVPTSWKLNRRLFRQAMKQHLQPSKWLLHADGRLPYFKWWLNMPVQMTVRLYRSIAKRLGLIKGNQGSWGDWNTIINSETWHHQFKAHEDNFDIIGLAPESRAKLTQDQQVNLLQVLHQINKLP